MNSKCTNYLSKTRINRQYFVDTGLKIGLFMGIMLVNCATFGQGGDHVNPYGSYTDGSAANAQRLRNKAVLDAKRVESTPNKPGPASTAGMNSKEYLKALGESEAGQAWARLLNPNAEKKAEKAKAQQIENEAIHQRALEYDLREKRERDRQDAVEDKIEQFYTQEGFFTRFEADNLSRKTLLYGRLTPDSEEYMAYPGFYRIYLNIAKSGSYEDVLASIDRFILAPQASMDALTDLQNRFPERRKEILKRKQNVWAVAEMPKSEQDWDAYQDKIYKKYPQNSAQADKEIDLYVDYLYPIEFTRELVKKNVYRSTIALTDYQKRLATYADPVFFRNECFHLCDYYLQYLKPEKILTLAAEKKLSAARIALFEFSDEEYLNIFNSRGMANSPYEKKAVDNLTDGQSYKIYTLAGLGDKDASAIYGLRIIAGFMNQEPAKSYKWLEQAVANGTRNAVQNMANICNYNVKEWKKTYCK